MSPDIHRRILLVDDNPAIHEDFKKILGGGGTPTPSADLADARNAFFGDDEESATPAPTATVYEIDTALQGQEALEKVRAAQKEGRPYSMAFMDVRMPPGWDGIETIARIWEQDPALQAVVCTAFSDYSRDDMLSRLGTSDRFLILKKPFDPIEVQQLASALTEKWGAERREKLRLEEARRAEQEARSYAASLQTMNRALETSRAGAVAAAQQKSEFIAKLGQEIRTPMISILGATDLMREGEVEADEHKRQLELIVTEGRSLLAMLGNVLDISSLETGRMTLEERATSPERILADVRQQFESAARAKGLQLDVRCGTGVPAAIQVDPTRLRQILHHLVANAIQFTDKGSVSLCATLNGEQGGETYCLQLSVEDTGVGITPEQRGRLFEAFARADEPQRRREHGPGLGLALSRRLAQMLGAELDVESEPGRGSRFTLSLSLSEDVDATTLPAVDVQPTRSDSISLHGRVLLIEDVPTTQRLYSMYLSRAGASVDVADEGEAGVERALTALREGRPYDLILLDMQMPVLDGYAAAKKLRAAGCKTPIVAVTAHTLSGDRERCIAAGCDDYRAKPIEREALVALSREWIQHGVPPALPVRGEASVTKQVG